MQGDPALGTDLRRDVHGNTGKELLQVICSGLSNRVTCIHNIGTNAGLEIFLVAILKYCFLVIQHFQAGAGQHLCRTTGFQNTKHCIKVSKVGHDGQRVGYAINGSPFITGTELSSHFIIGATGTTRAKRVEIDCRLKALVQHHFQKLHLNRHFPAEDILCSFNIIRNLIQFSRAGRHHHQTNLRLDHNTASAFIRYIS